MVYRLIASFDQQFPMDHVPDYEPPRELSIAGIAESEGREVMEVAYDEMLKNDEGDWNVFIENIGVGTIYGYRLQGPLNNDSLIIADPYSKAAITQNSWRHIAKTLVIDENLTIGCGSDSIQILELQRQGKKNQTTKEFLLGSKINKGTILI